MPPQCPQTVSVAQLASMDDSALIEWRKAARAELETNPGDQRLAMLYDQSTTEMAERAARAWRM